MSYSVLLKKILLFLAAGIMAAAVQGCTPAEKTQGNTAAETAQESAAPGTGTAAAGTAVQQAEMDAGTAGTAQETASAGQAVSAGQSASADQAASAGQTASPDKAVSAVEPSEEVFVTLGFAGDLNLSEGWETTVYLDAQKRGIRDCFSDRILKKMRGYDLFMLNNEFTYSRRGKRSEKTFAFRADPDRVEDLRTLGTDLVLTANNHVFDYGKEAFLDTLKTLEEAKIGYVGAGRDLAAASEPFYADLYGKKIAYVAASCAEEHEDTIWTPPASEDSPGIFGCYDPEVFCRSVREAAENADFVVANVHWGYEYLDYYTQEQEELAGRLVEAGADAVIGTHPHVLQGIKKIGTVPVFYSLGNFWFNGEDLMTGMAELTLRISPDPEKKPELVQARFIPCIQSGLFTREADAEEKELILQHMREISFGTEISGEGVIR